MNVLVQILLAVVGISILVIVHETGHYLAARAFGMRVLRYSIGFGPTLFRYQPKGSPTTFQIGAIPFLAYVQIAGMNPYEEIDPNDPELYPHKSVFARIVTIVAGPLANYLAASLIIFSLAVSGWLPDSEPTEPMIVRAVLEGSPAAKAGVEPGDVIVKANGIPIKNVTDLQMATEPRAGQPTEYLVEREGKRLAPLTITPDDMEGTGRIGVQPMLRRIYVGFEMGRSAELAVVRPFQLTVQQIVGIAQLIRQGTIRGFTGPIGMGKIVAEQARQGLPDYLNILMILSVALGMFNLLPFPALDGGRLTFLSYELITRKRPNERFEAMVHMVGILFLLGLLVLVTFHDVMG